ncbi:MAG: metallophosphoesterase [Planctomycetota bacterium]|nr:MAG: metallophosphoesterase [Planctomycetota bacterium]
MARLALLSDVHGNLEALCAVLADIDRAGVDCIVCLGDVVGYGPDPDACVDLVSERCDVVVRGNHDEAALEPALAQRFNPHAQAGVEHARRRLCAERLACIAAWPSRSFAHGVELAHGCFGARRFAYVHSPQTAQLAFAGLSAELGAVGHTHLPAVFAASVPEESAERVTALAPPAGAVVTLRPGCRHIVNPGSVGQPRDRNPHAAWALLDVANRTYQLRRVAYCVGEVERKMRRAGLPGVLWERLRVGA